MTLAAALLIVALVVVATLRRAEVRLTLLLGALALGCLAGRPLEVVQAFLRYFTDEQFLLPIGCCMGFAHVLRSTGCDQHLVHLLLAPVRRIRSLLIPGVVLVGVLVNIPIISQSSTAVAVGSVLVPVLSAARLSPVTIGASLVLGSSIGGELVNPGAPELRSVSSACNTSAIACIEHTWPLLLIHLAVTIPLFWWICARAEGRIEASAPPQEDDQTFRVHPIKALVPVLPLVLLFLTAMPPSVRLIHLPPEWLVGPDEKPGVFDTRLIGLAMLIGVVVAALTSPAQAGQTARVFFEGAGYALANVTSLIIVAGCFGKGIMLVGLAEPLQEAIRGAPRLLMPLAALFPLAFAWVSGSGMASTQSLFGFFVEPTEALGTDPLRVGAVVALAAAAGRTLSPVAAVVLMAASLTETRPLDLVRRLALPLLLGVAAVRGGRAGILTPVT
ncbi:MAG: C4-dicarboxylate transporter DcuC [Gemmataceae bacterium]